MDAFIFLWLQNQYFYKKLQEKALEAVPLGSRGKNWADIGCSTGLITRLAHAKGYNVTGYDLNSFSLFIAKILTLGKTHISYKKEDLFTLDQSYDVVSATSLLSVIEVEKEALAKLVALLKDENSTLILIEPTEKMTVVNVKKLITGVKSWWYYKGLLLWAKAREGKSVSIEIFETLEGYDVTHHYYLNDMVRVTSIKP